MRWLSEAWMFATGLIATVITLVLPYRLRLLFAKLLLHLTNPLSWTASVFYQRYLRFWNKVILGLVYFLAFPFAKVLLKVFGKTRLAPEPQSPTFWVQRPPPEHFSKQIKDPF